MDGHRGARLFRPVRAAVVLVVAAAASFVVAGPTALALAEPAPSFVRTIGTEGSDQPWPGDLQAALEVAVSPTGDVYIADAGNRIVRYSALGTFLGSWRGEDSAAGAFVAVNGLAVAASGAVYVADEIQDRVVRFTADGQYVSQWGTEGSADGQFVAPSTVAVGPDGNVWVAQSGGDLRVQRFTASGAFVSRWQLCPSSCVAVSDLGVAGDGSVYATSVATDSVHHLDAAGATLATFGGLGSADGKFRDPDGVAVAGDGSVYVADTENQRIQRFTGAGAYMSKWGQSGTTNSRFTALSDVAVGASGDVYTTDRSPLALRSVQRFNASGTWLGSWASLGDGLARFRTPKDVAVAGDGGLVVADSGNHRVSRAGPDLVFDTHFGTQGSGPGQFQDPSSVALAPNGDVYVADTGNHRVQRFTAAGSFVSTWGTWGNGPGQFDHPAGIEVDAHGDVWVADRGNDRIQRFSASGDLEAVIGADAGGVTFDSPSAVVVSSEGVFVADTGRERIVRLTEGGVLTVAWSTRTGASASAPRGLAADPRGGVWVVTDGSPLVPLSNLTRYTAGGTTVATGVFGNGGRGVAVRWDGNMFVAHEHPNVLLTQVRWAPGPLGQVELTARRPDAVVGQRIDYDLVVQNLGTTPFTGVTASFTAAPECNGPLPDLAVAERLTRTCSHVAQASDVGILSNQLTVTASELGSPLQSSAGAADVLVQASLDPPSVPPSAGQFGGAGTEPGQLQAARDIAVAQNGDVLVLNHSASVPEVDIYREGRPLRRVSFPGIADPPWRVAAGSGSSLYLLSFRNRNFFLPDNTIEVGTSPVLNRYSGTGTYLGQILPGSADSRPHDLASVPGPGSTPCYVATTENVFTWHDNSGQAQQARFGANELVHSCAGASSSSGFWTAVAASQAGVYTLQSPFSPNPTVSIHDGTTYRSSFPIAGPSNPGDVAADDAGNVYITYPDAQVIRMYSSAGAIVAQWSGRAHRVAVGPDGIVYGLDGTSSVVRMYGATLSGVVADEHTDAVLPGVVAVAVDSTGRVAGAAVSDTAGRYWMNVGLGAHRVVFVDPTGGHDGEWAWGHPLDQPTAGALINVPAGGATVNIGLEDHRGTIAGTVTSAGSGDAVPSAWVAALDLSTGLLRGTEAGPDGSYELDDLPAGDHLTMFVDPSGQRRFEFFDDQLYAQLADPVTVSARETSAANASLTGQGPFSSGSTISGTITDDESGDPIAGAWVVAVRTDGVMRAGAVADAAGHYSLTVGPGSYRVQAIDPAGGHFAEWMPDHPVDDFGGAPVHTVGVGGTITVDSGMAANRGAIAGTVEDPLGQSAGDLVLVFSLTHGGVAAAALTTWDGSYRVDGLLPGEYLVAFIDAAGEHGFEYHDNAANPGTATPVSVTAGGIATINAALT